MNKNIEEFVEGKHLTEESLGDYLKLIFPNNDFIHNKAVPESGISLQPDYRCDELMMIVEYDGYGHYCHPNEILRDEYKDSVYSLMGYTIIRIPYFVQMSKQTIRLLFRKNIDIQQEYFHGFINNSKTSKLPSYYCELGIVRFKEDLEKFRIIKDDILSSLEKKCIEYRCINRVLPPSLQYLVKEPSYYEEDCVT